MEKMRELVQQSTSSSTELAAAAEQMSKLSRNLLDSMDRFVIDDGHSDSRRFPPRRAPGGSERQSGTREYAEMART
jgi:hypothetical protein